MKKKNRQVIVENWGVQSYKDAWEKQEKILQSIIDVKKNNRNDRSNLETPNYLIFLEHKPVFTIGKSGNFNNLLVNDFELSKKNIELVKTNRGGDITFHGPGQLVIYPILDLENFFTDIHKYLRSLEDVVISSLMDFNIDAKRSPGETGVWINTDTSFPEKICAMGVRASRWVTMHGLALNINTDLSYFNKIIPCGIEGKGITSMQKVLNKKISIEKVKSAIKSHFEEIFDARLMFN